MLAILVDSRSGLGRALSPTQPTGGTASPPSYFPLRLRPAAVRVPISVW